MHGRNLDQRRQRTEDNHRVSAANTSVDERPTHFSLEILQYITPCQSYDVSRGDLYRTCPIHTSSWFGKTESYINWSKVNPEKIEPVVTETTLRTTGDASADSWQ